MFWTANHVAQSKDKRRSETISTEGKLVLPSQSIVSVAFLVLFLTFILVNFFFNYVSKRTFFNPYIQTSHFLMSHSQPFIKLFMFYPAEIVNPENSLFPN